MGGSLDLSCEGWRKGSGIEEMRRKEDGCLQRLSSRLSGRKKWWEWGKGECFDKRLNSRGWIGSKIIL
jgi:hypothetical protein